MPSLEAFPFAEFLFLTFAWLGGVAIFVALLFHWSAALMGIDPTRKWLRYRFVPFFLRAASLLMLIATLIGAFGDVQDRGFLAPAAFAMAVVLMFAARGAQRTADVAFARIPREDVPEEEEPPRRFRVVNGGKK